MEFRLFGEVTAVGGEGEFGLGSGRPAAVLSLLLLDPGRLITVERLVEQLWGEDAPPRAAHAVRVYVSRLRASLSQAGLDESVIVARSGGYLADVPESAVDLLRFEDLVSRAHSAGEGKESLEIAEMALALWTADPLAGFPYDDFALRERQRLTEARLDATDVWAEAALSVGRSSDVASVLAPMVDEHPYRERLWAHLATALYREERQTEALRTLAAARSALGDAGLELGPLLNDLEDSILHHDPALAARPVLEHNLPAPVDSFIGRSDEVAEIERLLQESRLVTLTGPGGCGKTRLALEAARHLLSRFDDRAWIVDLAVVTTAEALPQATAHAIGLGPWSRRGPSLALRERLGDQSALLVLDNCEHLIEASATLARELLLHCSGVRILATTREPLRIAGETVLVVPSLSVPEPHRPIDEFTITDAVELFVDRTQRAAPQFVLTPETTLHVSQIVRMLDGIPLAIELAAVRVRTLPIREMARRLDDMFGVLGVGSRTALPRHRTLEAALDWSTKLLDDREQNLFYRLGVFRSGFGLQAAAAVSGDGTVETIEALLAGLVEKSMVVSVSDNEPRYRLLEPIRQFSIQRLRQMGMIDEVEARRDAFYMAFADEAVSVDRRYEDPHWQHRFQRERPNLDASINSLLLKRNGEEAAALTAALTGYWLQLGLYEEGQRLIATVLTSGVSITGRTRLSLTMGGVWLAVHQGDYRAAESLAAEATALAEDEGSVLDKAGIFNALGSLNAEKGDMRNAREWLTKAIETTTPVEPAQTAPATINLAAVSAWAGDTAVADQLVVQGERLAMTGSPAPHFDSAFALAKGIAARMRGDLDAAGPLLDEAFTGFSERGPEFHLAYSQFERALVAFEEGDLDGAGRLCDGILARSEVGETPLLPRIRAHVLAARLAVVRGLPDRARAELLAALDEAQETGTVGGIAEAADAAGHLLHGTSNRTHARRLFVSSSSLRQDIDLARDPWEERQLGEATSQADPTSLDLPTVSDPDGLVDLIRQLTSGVIVS